MHCMGELISRSCSNDLDMRPITPGVTYSKVIISNSGTMSGSGVAWGGGGGHSTKMSPYSPQGRDHTATITEMCCKYVFLYSNVFSTGKRAKCKSPFAPTHAPYIFLWAYQGSYYSVAPRNKLFHLVARPYPVLRDEKMIARKRRAIFKIQLLDTVVASSHYKKRQILRALSVVIYVFWFFILMFPHDYFREQVHVL